MQDLLKIGQSKSNSGIFLPTSLNDLASAEIYSHQRKYYQSVDYVLADGMPIVWYLRWKLNHYVERLYGPNVVLELLSNLTQHTHAVIGNKNSLLRFSATFPDIHFEQIAIPQDSAEKLYHHHLKSTLKKHTYSILWIAISSPKQVALASYIKQDFPHMKIFCIGAAINILTDQNYKPPKLMQQYGLEWLFRLWKEPVRLGQRYLLTIPRGILQITIRNIFSYGK